MSTSETNDELPLCVNCDLALLKTSILHEAIFAFLIRNPFQLWRIPFWLLRPRLAVLAQITDKVQIAWPTLPLIASVVERIRSARTKGRSVILLTSMPKLWADELAAELGQATAMAWREEDSTSIIAKLGGLRRYDYIGHGQADRLLVESAHRATIVVSSSPTAAQLQRIPNLGDVIPRGKTGLRGYLKLIRVHQWVKNFLIWVPLLAAHRLASASGLRQATFAFLAFSCCASSVYVLNDLMDVEADRQHFRKKSRPIAAGTISFDRSIAVGAFLLLASAVLAIRESTLFSAILGTYFVMTLAYSLRLKRQVIVDVMLLAALYTIRVVAGAAATRVVPSFWLLAFSMFLFLSLAVVKRYSEMLVTLAQDKQYAAGRGYSVQDLPVLLSLGVGAGMSAVVVLALYINDPSTNKLYPQTLWLWPVPPLMLYWISRVWMKSHRGEMHDDPVVFAIRDWQSLLTLLLGASCFALAAVH
jgi:4-hydroxybenzoate polyprenyltransferase